MENRNFTFYISLNFIIAATAMVSKENLNSTINGSMKPSEIPAAVVIPKSMVLEHKIPDLLQPLKIEQFNNFPIEKPPTEPAPPGNLDINVF
jgi:hypothetical protein